MPAYQLVNNRFTREIGEACNRCSECDCREVGNECTREHPFINDYDCCVGLDFFYTDLDTGEALCTTCHSKDAQLEFAFS